MAVNYLTFDELGNLLIYTCSMEQGSTKNSLKAFLVCCYTGITLTQLRTLTHSNLIGDKILILNKEGEQIFSRVLPSDLVKIIGTGAPDKKIITGVTSFSIASAIFGVRSTLNHRRRITQFNAKATYINLIFNNHKIDNHENN
jgi:hypothetical protein